MVAAVALAEVASAIFLFWLLGVGVSAILEVSRCPPAYSASRSNIGEIAPSVVGDE